MTPIADMVEKMLSTGIPPETIVLAIRTAEETAMKTRDLAAEKRREWDRERKRKQVDGALLLKEVNKKEEERKKEPPRKGKHELPADWRPADPLTVKGEEELAKMRDWARANAIRKADWPATWRNWVRRVGGGCVEVVRLVASNDQYVSFDSPEMAAWEAHERATGKKYPRDKRGGWTFPTRWPPEVTNAQSLGA